MVSGILVEKSSTKQILLKKIQNFFSFLESNKKMHMQKQIMQNNAMHESMIPKTNKKSSMKVLL